MLIRIVTVFLCVLPMQLVYAENEFQFEVPVNIENIDFHRGQVRCDIYTSSSPAMGDSPYFATNSFSSEDTYPREVNVFVSTDVPGTMQSYRCKVEIMLNNGAWVRADSRDHSGFTQKYEAATGDRLSHVTAVIEGSL